MNPIQESKRLSYILRHNPGSIGLTLDPNGWAVVSDLITKMGISFSNLEYIVNTDNKKRYTFNNDKTKIRAAQGHSIDVDLALKPIQPPDILYHGTASRFWSSIDKQGLVKGSRQYVHLSLDIATATKVGQRHGSPIILKIDSKRMFEQGYKFFLSDNSVWLTDHVPREFIS